MKQNFPNPFNPTTTIEYTLPGEGRSMIEIFDSIGRLVRTFETNNRVAGNYKIIFDGKDDNGNILSSGVYYYRLIFHNNAEAKKMLLLK